MTQLNIKMLKDNKGNSFLPFSTTDSVFEADSDKTLKDILDEQASAISEVAADIPTNVSDLNNDAGYIDKNVNDLTNYTTTTDLNTALGDKVDKVSGKQLSTEDYTTAEKTKLSGIETGAEVNIIETVKVNGTALIPDQDRAVDITVAGSADNISYDNTTSGLTADDVQEAIDELASEKVDKVSGKGLSTNDYSTDEKNKLAGIEASADVNTIESISVNNSAVTPDANKNVDITVPTKVSDLNNDSGYITGINSTDVTTALGFTPMDSALKGANSGVAELDATGKVPSSQLPSYVDDVIEVNDYASLPTTGETGKIYITKDTNKTYRWSGSAYVEISESLALGETSSTAYRGDRGKTAYDHSQTVHAPSNAEHNTIETISLNGTALTPDTNRNVALTNIATTSDIPTVNNATLTIKKNNSSVGTFTANASSNVDIDITVPTKTSDLVNDSLQPTLISGTNIKTINNESLLGSGDIDISVIDEIEWGTSISNAIPLESFELNKIYLLRQTMSRLVIYVKYNDNTYTINSGHLSNNYVPIMLMRTAINHWYLYYIVAGTNYCMHITINSSTNQPEGTESTISALESYTILPQIHSSDYISITVDNNMFNNLKNKDICAVVPVGTILHKNSYKLPTTVNIYVTTSDGEIDIEKTNYKITGNILIFARNYSNNQILIFYIPTQYGIYICYGAIDEDDNATDLVLPEGDISQYTGYSSSDTQVLSHDSSGNKIWTEGGGGGAIDSISVNGVAQTIDVNKNVDITVPTEAKDITCTLKVGEPTNWSAITWSDFSPSSGRYIWTDGSDIYYSYGSNSSYQKIFNKNTKTWESKTWNNLPTLFDAKNVWTDGTNTYYSQSGTNKVLDKSTSTWNTKTWSFSDPTINFNGSDVWTDGTDIYVYVEGYGHFVLNGSSWSEKTFQGTEEYSLYTFDASCVWTDGTDIYYNGLNAEDVFVSLVLNKNTSTWSVKSWTGLTDFNGKYIWTDGTDIYYSNGANQYKLDKSTGAWSAKSWTGLTSFDRQYIWIVDEDVYYSNSNNQYKLDSAQTMSVQDALDFILQNMNYAKNIYTNPSDTSDKNIWIETNNS